MQNQKRRKKLALPRLTVSRVVFLAALFLMLLAVLEYQKRGISLVHPGMMLLFLAGWSLLAVQYAWKMALHPSPGKKGWTWLAFPVKHSLYALLVVGGKLFYPFQPLIALFMLLVCWSILGFFWFWHSLRIRPLVLFSKPFFSVLLSGTFLCLFLFLWVYTFAPITRFLAEQIVFFARSPSLASQALETQQQDLSYLLSLLDDPGALENVSDPAAFQELQQTLISIRQRQLAAFDMDPSPENHEIQSFLISTASAHLVALGTLQLFTATNPEQIPRTFREELLEASLNNISLTQMNLERSFFFYLQPTLDTASLLPGTPRLLSFLEQQNDLLFALLRLKEESVKDYWFFRVERAFEWIWGPIQREICILVTHREYGFRTTKFIGDNQIRQIEKELQPGDLLIKRSNWQVTNMGIDGFWTHSGIYLGNLEKCSAFFSGITAPDGRTFPEVLREDFPQVFQILDAGGFFIMEGVAAGAVVNPLESIARVDYLAALRPRLSKEDVMLALLKAFTFFGVPYDYGFDFLTNDELVCSELIYKAYSPEPGKEGLHFRFEPTNGIMMLSPNHFAKKFDEEASTPQQELDLVFFYDALEKEGVGFRSSQAAFRETWKRSRWDFLQQ